MHLACRERGVGGAFPTVTAFVADFIFFDFFDFFDLGLRVDVLTPSLFVAEL